MQKQNWIKQIEQYQPHTTQEVKDKAEILHWASEYSNLLTRENTKGHMTSSSFVMDESMTYILMAYHHIYQSYSWTGGHTDGEEDFLAVAWREAKEETGVKWIEPFSKEIIALDILPVPAHIKKGKEVEAHQHLNVCYLFIAKKDQPLQIKADENSAVDWIKAADLDKAVTEDFMIPVYQKILNRAKQWKEEKEIS